MFSRILQRVVTMLVAVGSLILVGAGSVTPTITEAQAAPAPSPLLVVGPVIARSSTQPPPTSAFCLANFGIACYGPSDMRNEYDVNPLYAQNVQGAGETIAIFDSFGSPTIQSDLHTFDVGYGLSDPPSFQIIYPEGKPQLNYNNIGSPANFHNKNILTEIGWAYETTLDVEWAHAIAPEANILLVPTPVAESSGVQGLQNILNAEQYVLDHHLANVFSQSFGTVEQGFPGASDQQLLQRFHQTYQQAAAQGVSVFASSGDFGVTNIDKHFRFFPFPTVEYPASDPSVSAVGGTEINPPPAVITSYSAEQVWNATGGGYSVVFTRPDYQNGVVSNNMRGIPDIAYNAGFISAVTIYESFDPVGAAWALGIGTSAAAPQWAGLAALADNYAAKNGKAPVGFLNPTLYQLGQSPSLYAQDFHDITVGDNSIPGVPGFSATTGWDAVSGWGTPDAAHLIPDLVSVGG